MTVGVDDAEPVVQGRFGDQKVRDRRSMPHAVVMRQVALQRQCPLEEIVGGHGTRKHRSEITGHLVVFGGRPRGIAAFELTDGTDEELPGERFELAPATEEVDACRRAPVEDPTAYCHISSERRTSRSM